jgi:hypothetical protein
MHVETVGAVSVARRAPTVERLFYIGMGILAILVASAGFLPGIVNASGRTAPLTTLVVVHGAVFLMWLMLFVVQATLVATRRTQLHRRLGPFGALLAIAMIVLGYASVIAMGRRGFDLSGDLGVAADPLTFLVLPLGDLAAFAILVGSAFAYRRRPVIHKRLMLLATIGTLMPAPLAHLIGHTPMLRAHPAIIVIPIAILLSLSAIHDRVAKGRIHPVSLWVALALFAWANLRAAVIGPSAAWHRFAGWLIG